MEWTAGITFGSISGLLLLEVFEVSEEGSLLLVGLEVLFVLPAVDFLEDAASLVADFLSNVDLRFLPVGEEGGFNAAVTDSVVIIVTSSSSSSCCSFDSFSFGGGLDAPSDVVVVVDF